MNSFSVFKLLLLHLKENEIFKPKISKPQPIPANGLYQFRRLPPAYIVLVGYRQPYRFGVRNGKP